MREVFADTGYWIALLDPRDALHGRALELWRDPVWRRIVMSEWILLELLNYFAEKGDELRTAASGLVTKLATSPDVEIVAFSRESFADALRLYRERQDKPWSLTDCSSFLIMKERGIGAALTHDRHFEQAGFHALMRP